MARTSVSSRLVDRATESRRAQAEQEVAALLGAARSLLAKAGARTALGEGLEEG